MMTEENVQKLLRGDLEPSVPLVEEDFQRYGGKGSGTSSKKKAKEIKTSIKRRRHMTDQEYRDLLVDRRRRIDVIDALLPIILDREAMNRIGLDDAVWCASCLFLVREGDAPAFLKECKSILCLLEEAVFKRNLPRKRIMREMGRMDPFGRVVEKTELAVDFFIWRMKAPLQTIEEYALRLTPAEWGRLAADPALAKSLRYAVDQHLTQPGTAQGGAALYRWNLSAHQAQKMKVAFPWLASDIEAGIYV